MRKIYLYADEASRRVLLSQSQKIIAIGGDFGYGNFGDVLQHVNALKAIKHSGKYDTIAIMAAKAMSHQQFPSWVLDAYKTDAVLFVADYPLLLSETDPKISPVGEINNLAGVCLYGGGFLNAMWGDYVLSVVEHFLQCDPKIAYWVSGQQITPPFQGRVLDHIKAFQPQLFGVRDELSLQILTEQGFEADYSFDDAAEALTSLNERIHVRRGEGLFLHLNSSDYTANTSLQYGLGRELARLANCEAANKGVTAFQAFRDTRQDVFDTIETIKRLDYLFPFHSFRAVDLVGLVFNPGNKSRIPEFEADFAYSCSYHVTLWLQLAGIPCWLRSANSFYDQKSRALQVTQGLENFLKSPKLADHSYNLERRAAWNEKMQMYLLSLEPIQNCLRFDEIKDGPAPWPFFYKGKPTQQEKLNDAERLNRSQQARVEALTAQLTELGNEAHGQRERADLAERHRDELQARGEALTAQLTRVLSSKSWRFTSGLRFILRLLRGEIVSVRAVLRRAFMRNHR